jgi:hypothetical protein
MSCGHVELRSVNWIRESTRLAANSDQESPRKYDAEKPGLNDPTTVIYPSFLIVVLPNALVATSVTGYFPAVE